MAQNGHNLVLFGQPGPHLTRVVQTLKGLGGRLRLAPTWSSLDLRLGEGETDCAVLCLTAEQENDEAFVRDAFERVTAAGAPAIVVLGRPLALDRAASPAVATFDVVVGSPLDPAVLGEAINLAITLAPGVDTYPTSPAVVTLTSSEDRPGDFSGEADDDDLSDSKLEVRSWGKPAPPVGDTRDFDTSEHVVSGGAAHPDARVSAKGGRHETGDAGSVSDTGTKMAVRRWDRVQPAHESPATTGAERLDEDEPTGPPHVSELPPLDGGSLAHMPPYRVLLAHAIGHSTGHLRLENGGIVRELALLEGEPGVLEGALGERERRKFQMALLWTAGRYQFEPTSIERVRFRSLGSALELVHAALYEGMTLNQASNQLAPHFKAYVVPTERTRSQRETLSKLPGLISLLEGLVDEPVEQLVARAGASFEAVLKNLVFCSVMDLVSFSDSPGSGPVPVKFTAAAASPARTPTPPPETPPPPPQRPTQPSQTLDAPPEQSEDSSPNEAVPVGPELRERPLPPPLNAAEEAKLDAEPIPEDEASDHVIEELAALVEDWRGKNAYYVFGLSQGCGRGALRDRYYELVRVHHPDTYGLARSPEVKPLAEMVFRIVQKAYNELRRVETGDSAVVPSGGASASGPSGAGPRGAADQTSPGSRVADDSSTPGSRGATDRAARRGRSNGGRASPGERDANDRSKPGTRDANDRSKPGTRDANDRSRPGTRVAADSVGSGIDSSPNRRAVLAGAMTDNLDRSRPGIRPPIATPAEVVGSVPDSGSQPGQRGAKVAGTDDATTPPSEAAQPVPEETPVPRRSGSGTGPIPVLRDPALDSTARVRALRTLSGDFAGARTPGSLAAVAAGGSVPPEQHFRNGLNMVKAGAFDRAVEEFEAAAEGRDTSTLYRAHLAWARYKVDPSTAEEQKRELRQLAEDAAAQEHACVYLGHILSAEGDDGAALNYYQLSLTVNPRNIEALRRVRLHRMRNDSKKEGLFDRLFSKKTKKKSR